MKYILTFLTTCFINYSYGCDCDSIMDSTEAKSIFTGTVISISHIIGPLNRYEIIFKIDNAIKGEFKDDIVAVSIRTLSESGCGIPFEIDKKYIVYTFMQFNFLYTNSCTWTKLI